MHTLPAFVEVTVGRRRTVDQATIIKYGVRHDGAGVHGVMRALGRTLGLVYQVRGNEVQSQA